MNPKKWMFILLLVMAAGLLAACSATSANNQGSLKMETLAGEQVDLTDYENQIVIVNFWATWCGPCRVEMPELQAYYDAHKDNPNFAMLVVNRGETKDAAQAFIEEGSYTFPVVLDREEEVVDYFGGVRGMPTTFVLDQNNEVIYQHTGALNRNVLEQEVTPLLEGSS